MTENDLSKIQATLTGNKSEGILEQAKQISKVLLGEDLEYDFEYPIRYSREYRLSQSSGQGFTPGATISKNITGNFFAFNPDDDSCYELSGWKYMYCGTTCIGRVNKHYMYLRLDGTLIFHSSVITLGDTDSEATMPTLVLLTDLDYIDDYTNQSYVMSQQVQKDCINLQYFVTPRWITKTINTNKIVLGLGYCHFVIEDGGPTCRLYMNARDTFAVEGEVELY